MLMPSLGVEDQRTDQMLRPGSESTGQISILLEQSRSMETRPSTLVTARSGRALRGFLPIILAILPAAQRWEGSFARVQSSPV